MELVKKTDEHDEFLTNVSKSRIHEKFYFLYKMFISDILVLQYKNL